MRESSSIMMLEMIHELSNQVLKSELANTKLLKEFANQIDSLNKKILLIDERIERAESYIAKMKEMNTRKQGDQDAYQGNH